MSCVAPRLTSHINLAPPISAGYSGLWPGAESAAAAETETYDPKAPPGRHLDPVFVALLRLRRALIVGGHLEDTSGALPQPTHVSVTCPDDECPPFSRFSHGLDQSKDAAVCRSATLGRKWCGMGC